MNDFGKQGSDLAGEEITVDDFAKVAKAVKTLAEQKQRAFGPDGADLAKRKAELQRQKIALHTPKKGTTS